MSVEVAAPGEPGAPAAEPLRGWHRIRRRAADFWLNFLFNHATHRPWFVRLTKPFFLWFAWRTSPVLRSGPQANARWLLGPESTPRERRAFAKRVIGNFYDFVGDIGRAVRMDRAQLRALVEAEEGQDHYRAARAAGRGAIVVTAHLGNFEVGAAALLEHEKVIHVVYHRDLHERFESLRSSQRRRLGIVEAHVEDGWTMWLQLRDVLEKDGVVLLQGDRVMPGQRGVKMPMLGGHVMLPTGPIKLAMATGAPLIPVFIARTPQGRFRIHIEPAIHVSRETRGVTAEHPGMLELARIIETYIRRYPDQWLVLQRAWCEDGQGPE